MFDTGTLDGFTGTIKLVASMSLFFCFSEVQVLVGLRKQFVNKFVFPTWACAAGFNNNNDKYIHLLYFLCFLTE